MATTIGKLSLIISATTGALKSGLDQGAAMVGNFATKATDKVKAVGAAAGEMGKGVLVGESPFKGIVDGAKDALAAIPLVGAAIAATFATGVALASKFNSKILELRKVAIKLGTDMGTISTLKFVARDDFEALTAGLTKFQNKLGDAATGGVEQQKNFHKMGLEWEALSKMKLADQVDTIAKKMNAISDPVMRARFMFETFGKSGMDLIPVFTKLAKGMALTSEEAEKLNKHFTELQATQAKAMKSNLKELEERAEGVGNRMAGMAIKVFDTETYTRAFAAARGKITEWDAKHRPKEVEITHGLTAEQVAYEEKRNAMMEKYKSILESLENPFEKYTAAIGRHNEALKLTAITQQNFVDLTAQAKKQLLDGLGVGDKLTPTTDYMNKRDNLRKLLEEGTIQIDAFNEKMQAVREEFIKTQGAILNPVPLEQWRKQFDEVKRLNTFGFIDRDFMLKMNDQLKDKLLADSGIHKVTNPFDAWVKSVEKLRAMLAAGAIEATEFDAIVGRITQDILSQQQQVEERKPPEALLSGTAAAFSAINKFERGDAGVLSPLEALKDLAAKQLIEQQKQSVNTKDLLDELKRAGPVKVLGLP